MPSKREKIEDLAETVIAFANFSGGVVIVGVTDDGQIVGAGPDGED